MNVAKREAFERHEKLFTDMCAVLAGQESALVGATLGELLAGWLCHSFPDATERAAVAELVFTAIREMLATEQKTRAAADEARWDEREHQQHDY